MYLLFIQRGTHGFDAGTIHYEDYLKGWAVESRLFWGLKWQRAKKKKTWREN
jgi:hypothetical protein